MRFVDKTVVVTGGSSGMGLAVASAFLLEGANVAICGRSQAKLDRAAETLNADKRILTAAVDVSQVSDLDRFYRQVSDRFDQIDVVFANAGIGVLTGLGEVDEATFDKIVGVNFKGVFFTVQQALPYLTNGGAIVLNASLTQHQGLSDLTVYAATKAAVSQLARSFATSLMSRCIRVNAISPGVIETDMIEGMDDEKLQTLSREIPMGRLGRSEEIAKVVLFLASEEASYITGEDLLVDGGRIRLSLWQGA